MDKKAKASLALFIISLAIFLAVALWGIIGYADAVSEDATNDISLGRPLMFIFFLIFGGIGCAVSAMFNMIGVIVHKRSETPKRGIKITQFIFIFIPLVFWGATSVAMFLAA